MYPKTITAVKLIAFGIRMLAYTGITYAIIGKPRIAFGSLYGN